MDTKYKEQFINITERHKSNQPNMHLTNYTTGEAAQELNQSNEGSNKHFSIQYTAAGLQGSLKKTLESKNNAWPVY